MVMFTIALSILMNFGLVKKCHAMPDILPRIMEEFKIYQPTILLNNMFEMKKMTQIVKNINYQGYSIGFSQNHLNQYQSGLIFTDDLTKFKWNNSTHAAILVVTRIECEQDLKEVEVSIGSEVIFLDRNSLKIYESYKINNVQITRYLGQFQANNVSQTVSATFVPLKDYIPNMENRRGNFYGIELTAAIAYMTEDPGNYSNLVTFFRNNDTYDITKLANNPKFSKHFIDILERKILKRMESKFNFTTKYILRKDMKFGSPYISSNGSTVIGEGLFQYLSQGSIDLVTVSFKMLPIRLLFAEFLPTIYSAHYAIFVPIEDVSEEIDWNVFFEPFAIDVWITIVIKCVIFTLLVSIIEWFHDIKLFYYSVIYNIFASFGPNFGVAPFESKIHYLTSYKALLFSFTIDGLVLWISYQSFMYFELSTATTKDPFNDLDSLANSDYMLYTGPRDWAVYNTLSSTQTYEKVMKNNVDPKLSFNSWDISVEKTLNAPKSALFADTTFLEWGLFWEIFTNHKFTNLPCLFKSVWTTPLPTFHSSIMMKKGSQFTRIFTHEMKKLQTTGNLDLLKKRYMGPQICKPLLKEKPLGFEKLSFLFAILIFGFIMSILVVFIEYMTQNKKNKEEFSSKGKEIEEKVCEYLEIQALPNQEKENILARLFQKYFRKSKDETNLNMIRRDDFNFELDPKKFPSKIPRPITRINCL